MASLLIRNLDERVKARLRLQAAGNSRSMEEEAREILASILRAPKDAEENLATAIHSYFEPFGGWDVELPSRASMRQPPDFSGPEYDGSRPQKVPKKK